MSHLEQLIAEYHQWRGHFVRTNVMVGKRELGGWDMELDVVAYDPHAATIYHIEPSLDAHPWSKREERFTKKFEYGKAHIPQMFSWLPPGTKLIQRAVLVRAGKDRRVLAGAEVQTVDELMLEIKTAIAACGVASRAAISEGFPLLRTIQLAHCGYYGVL